MARILHKKTFRRSDGLTLTADVGGREDAPTVILAHGVCQTRHSWRGAMHSLVDRGYHVIGYDTRGHGDSDWSADGRYNLDILSDDLRCILKSVKQPYALVGASLGGVTSLFTVGDRGAPLAECLILVDIVLHPDMAGVLRIRDFMAKHHQGFASLAEAANAVAAYKSSPSPKDPAGLMKNLRLRDNGRLYWHWDPQLMLLDNSEPPPTVVQAMSVADKVKLPTLLVRGRKSDVVTDEGIDAMRAIVPQMEVFDVPDAGHMIAGDRNDAFNGGILSFLDRHLPPSA